MIETAMVRRILQDLSLDAPSASALGAFAALLEESRLSPGLVLWAWDSLGVVQLTPDEKPAAMAVLLGLFLAEARGHTVLGFDSPELGELARLLRTTTGGDWTRDRLRERFLAWQKDGTLAPLAGLAGEGPGAATLTVTPDGLQFSRTRWMERECARLLRERFEAPPEPEPGTDPLADHPGPLDPDQRRMIRGALGRRLYWISGGPGTGKTSCIHGLLWAIGRVFPGLDPGRIALAAPTGKAGFRVTEGLRRLAAGHTGPFDEAILDGRLEARTLHRLLEYRPDQDRFGRHEGTPLEAAWVIVDESSMVDLGLCHALLRALPATASLVWIGDRDQLPAVGRGAVFQASWAKGPARYPGHYFRLERNYRAQVGLARDLGALMAGCGLPWVGPSEAFPASDRLVQHRVDTERALQELLDALFAGTFDDAYWDEVLQPFDWDPARSCCPAGAHPRQEALIRLSARANGTPVLCVTHGGPRGTIAVNGHFSRRHPWAGQGLLPGEPVMVQTNDYQRDLWNGDTGIVIRVRRGQEETPCAAFPQGDRLRIFPLAGLPVAPAYAFSVHKSQGSEFSGVTLVLPEGPAAPLTRELVYTAITRGRSCVRVAGTPEVLAAGLGAVVERRMNLDRWLFGE